MSKKPALGKGLSALLENADTDIMMSRAGSVSDNPETVGSISEIALSEIEVNPFQPRTEFDKEALMELAGSIRQHGIIQPLTVRKLGRGKYQLISGERRFRASQAAGLERVPCYIRIADDQTVLEMALVENIQREDLNAIEVGISYQRLIEECDLTQEQLSIKVGKKRSTITNYLRLLKLPAEIQSGLMRNSISMGHARALLGLESEKEQLKVYERIQTEGLSVRDVEKLVRGEEDASKKVMPKSPGRPSLSFEQQRFKSGLSRLLGKSIKLKMDKNGKGSIVIPFEDDDELRDIAHSLDI
ncbi:MAG: ParB/RepB/Spo0J family partition protein [Flavobacteriales bacterium]|nr:ParB/RepB/Spo0J family partition protein [Flavobacteriales bacterium]